MPVYKKVFTSVYCKIYTDNFSEEMVDQMAASNEIYEFLMKDAGQCFDESGDLIPGDCNIWYLGCNEKFGYPNMIQPTYHILHTTNGAPVGQILMSFNSPDSNRCSC